MSSNDPKAFALWFGLWLLGLVVLGLVSLVGSSAADEMSNTNRVYVTTGLSSVEQTIDGGLTVYSRVIRPVPNERITITTTCAP